MSNFSSLRLALTALEAQRRGLELAAQNAANVNTEGYSRQRVDLESIGAPAVPALWSRYTGDGGGVRVADVTRFRDQFLEIRAALEHGANASLDAKRASMERIQQLFDEPSDSGIQQQLSDLWAGFDDVANHPSDTASRTQLLERAATLAASFNTAGDQLSQMRTDTIGELGATNAEINATSAQVARLNKAIKANTIADLPVNDLKDQRDLAANKLAELSGATLHTTEFGQVNVVLNGTALAQEDHSADILLDTSGSTVVFRFTRDNSLADVRSGKAGGQLEAVNVTIPSYITSLDAVATSLRDQVNTLHGAIAGSLAASATDQSATGNLQFDLSLDGGAFATTTIAGADWSGAGAAATLQTALQASVDAAIGVGNATVNVTGGAGNPLAVTVAPTGTHTLHARTTGVNAGFSRLFGETAVGTDGVGGRMLFTGANARTLTLSNDVAGNPDAVAAGVAAGGPVDGSRALTIAETAQSRSGTDATYRQLIARLGADTRTAQRRSSIQDNATTSLDSARSAGSAVNLDEEMTSMVEYQHAYEAAARLMAAIDSMLDTLINKT